MFKVTQLGKEATVGLKWTVSEVQALVQFAGPLSWKSELRVLVAPLCDPV